MKCDEEAGSGGCEDLMVERIRYFTGRHMTARDFRDADAYHRSFRHLHNRVLHGWGIACGLEVDPHWRPECRKDRLVVRCGLALDCCGREIVVPGDVVTPPMPWDDRPKAADTESGPLVLLLCLKYREVLGERVPVLYSAQACSNPRMEDGRIRECSELCWHWVRRDELGQYGWMASDPCPPKEDEKPRPQEPEPPAGEVACPDEGPTGQRCCLVPDCPSDHCVPLAIILPKAQDTERPQYDIDTAGRRSLAHAREHLTHICWISWPHGGVVKASELRSLSVRFDRALRPSENPLIPGPRGINERTFVVQYGQQLEDRQMEDLDFVEYVKPPYLMKDRQTAVYEIHKPLTYRSHVLHVTLRCDFIVDCHGNPIDGDHLRGRRPTGNGVPGGTFESWFRVVDDAEYDRIDPSSRPALSAEAQE